MVEPTGSLQDNFCHSFPGLVLSFSCNFFFLSMSEGVSGHMPKFSCHDFGALSGAVERFGSVLCSSLLQHHMVDIV